MSLWCIFINHPTWYGYRVFFLSPPSVAIAAALFQHIPVLLPAIFRHNNRVVSTVFVLPPPLVATHSLILAPFCCDSHCVVSAHFLCPPWPPQQLRSFNIVFAPPLVATAIASNLHVLLSLADFATVSKPFPKVKIGNWAAIERSNSSATI